MDKEQSSTLCTSQENIIGPAPPVKDTNRQIGLKRTLGIPGGIAILVGTIIGAGIFATPRWIMMYTGSVGLNLVIWSVCGIFALCGGLCYLELGTMIPKSGAEYAYILEAFGPLPAFLYSWVFVIFLKPSGVLILLTFGTYVLEPFYPGSSGREEFVPLIKLLAGFALGVITLVNCLSVKWAERMQIVFTVAKMLAIILLIVTGIVRLAQGHTSSFVNAFDGSTTDLGLIGFAFYNGLFAYDGWSNLNLCTEEIKDPERNLPRCIWMSIPIVTISYILVNIGYLTVLSPHELMTSNAVAVTVANRLYGVMAWSIPILVACSCFGCANGGTFGAGRLLFASAREGHMPSFLAMVHTKRHTPLPAILFNCIATIIFLVPESSTFESLLNFTSFITWFVYGLMFFIVLMFRFTKKDIYRPYKVWIGIPCFMLIVSIYLVVAPFSKAPYESMICIAAFLSGVPFYFVFVYYKAVPKCIMDRYDKAVIWLQKILDVALPTEQE